jgi:LuxR family quorum sensing-dependent transcriptional regulator
MSRRDLDTTLAFVDAIDRAGSIEAVSETLLDIVKPYGFSAVLAGIIPTPGMSVRQQLSNVVLHRWPHEWSRRYFAQGYLYSDPTIDRLTSRTDPFLWSEIEPAYRDSAAARRVMNEAGQFGLSVGFTVPMLTLEGQSAGLSIAGTQAELPPFLRGGFPLLAVYAFARAISRDDESPPVKLTARESDVLHWIAEGKTDWEIGKILHVSEHLVDKVARQIRIKIGAANRVQAVALALRHKIIC